jgi:hypothetical protein
VLGQFPVYWRVWAFGMVGSVYKECLCSHLELRYLGAQGKVSAFHHLPTYLTTFSYLEFPKWQITLFMSWLRLSLLRGRLRR